MELLLPSFTSECIRISNLLARIPTLELDLPSGVLLSVSFGDITREQALLLVPEYTGRDIALTSLATDGNYSVFLVIEHKYSKIRCEISLFTQVPCRRLASR